MEMMFSDNLNIPEGMTFNDDDLICILDSLSESKYIYEHNKPVAPLSKKRLQELKERYDDTCTLIDRIESYFDARGVVLEER